MSQENNFVPEQETYKPLSPFKLFVKSNFPFIEATFESLDNYGLYCKIVEYLNNVIENENHVEDNVTSLYNAFVSLNTYVSDYFDNLDVQQEINNKLDTLVENGTMTQLLSVYVAPEIARLRGEVNAVEDQLVGVASGSPAGTYATKSALEAADPNHSRIYIVNADGKWYYYNTTNSEWTAGGTYQAAEDSTTVTNLVNNMNEVKPLGLESVQKIYGRNLYNYLNENNLVGYYVGNYGTNVITNPLNTNYNVSHFIKVKGNTTYAMNGNTGAGKIGCYDSNQVLLDDYPSISVSYDSTNRVHNFTTPVNCSYVRITLFLADYNPTLSNWIVQEGTTLGPYQKYTDYFPIFNERILPDRNFISATNLNNNRALTLTVPDVKNYNIITFDCNITSYDFIQIRHGLQQAYASSIIKITSSDVILLDSSESASGENLERARFSHGLRISQHMTVIIDCYAIDKCKLTITVPTGQFVQDMDWQGCSGMVYVQSASTLTNAKLSFFVYGYNKPIWAFGDSYFDMWPKVAEKMGFNNCLFDGFGGRGSVQALASLKLALNNKYPKAIIWCLGMNDGDSSEEIDEDWKDTFDELIEICQKNNIELIACTIPNTPTIQNTFKNSYIKSSGVRYIDLASAVGASSFPSSWYDGLLSDDNVHPTYNYGQQVLASAVVGSVPELINDDFQIPELSSLEHIEEISITDEYNSLVYKNGIVYVSYQGTINQNLSNGQSFIKIGPTLRPSGMGSRLAISGEVDYQPKTFFISNNQGSIYTTGPVTSGSRVSFTFCYYLGYPHYGMPE